MQITAQWHDDAWYTTGGANATGRREPIGERGRVAEAAGGKRGGLERDRAVWHHGERDADVDGSFTDAVERGFHAPGAAGGDGGDDSAAEPESDGESTGGTIAGGADLYYAISAVDASGAESGLSFVVRGDDSVGDEYESGQLTGFSFSGGTRGVQCVSGAESDATAANRVRMLRSRRRTRIRGGGELARSTGSRTTIMRISTGGWNCSRRSRREFTPRRRSATARWGCWRTISRVAWYGSREAKARRRNAGGVEYATTLTVTPAWTVIPDSTSFFMVADSTWNFGGFGATSPVQIDVPNRPGATVEISGRSANALDEESTDGVESSDAWQIGGGGGGGHRAATAAGVRAEPGGARDDGSGGDRVHEPDQYAHDSRRGR